MLHPARLQSLSLLLPPLLGLADLPLDTPGLLAPPWPEELRLEDVAHLGKGQSEINHHTYLKL